MTFKAIFTLEDYENYLKYLVQNQFIVCNFKELEEKYKDHSELPKKFVVLRHDVHHRDIENAYKMINLEQKIFGKNVATYFVQWNFIGSTDYENNYENQRRADYETFILYCIKNNIHVLPHLSVFCHSYLNLYNRKESNLSWLQENNFTYGIKDNSGVDLLKTSINQMKFNFQLYHDTNCIKCNNPYIEQKLETLISDVEKYLQKYKSDWEKKFNIGAETFSAHGDGITLTKKFNPNVFGSLNIFENIMNNANSGNIYIGAESKFKLYYKSDSNMNPKIIKNNFYDETYKQYQILTHPKVWSN